MTNTDRFEFRAFARNFGQVEDRIRALAKPERIVESDDVYIVSAHTDTHNLKIRGGLLDIKILINEMAGLEQWSPALKIPLPIGDRNTENRILSALNVKGPDGGLGQYGASELIDQWARHHPALYVACVFKRRFIFPLAECLCELADVSINGAWCMTACIESTDHRIVARQVQSLGLAGYQNENYLKALKRVLGLTPLPLFL
ncbi:MAG TPA: hypothetical protein VIK82_04775 [Porticoccaceae bacterium]